MSNDAPKWEQYNDTSFETNNTNATDDTKITDRFNFAIITLTVCLLFSMFMFDYPDLGYSNCKSCNEAEGIQNLIAGAVDLLVIAWLFLNLIYAGLIIMFAAFAITTTPTHQRKHTVTAACLLSTYLIVVGTIWAVTL